jgi:hypothetical protein
MNTPLRWITSFYASLLRLYPPAFVQEMGDEMKVVFAQMTTEAQQHGGWSLFSVCWREVRDLPGSLAEAHRNYPQGGFAMKKTGFFLMTLLISFLIVWIGFGSRLGGIWVILIGLVVWFFLSLLLWQARKMQTKKVIYISLAVLLGLFWPTSSLIESEKFFKYHLPQPFLSILDILIYSCFILALVLAAVLIDRGVRMIYSWLNPPAAAQGDSPIPGKRDGRMLAMLFGLSAGLLLMFLHNLSGLIMWDNTYDAIEGIWLFMPILTSLLCGIVLTVNLPGKTKLVGLLFVLFVPLMIYTVYVPAMNIDFRTMTRERGERLTYAIETYYNREGHYPKKLAQLTPRDLRTIQPPFILNGQNWCYDAGANYYRLGYVDREHWSSPCFKGVVFSYAGSLSDLTPVCETAIAALTVNYEEIEINWCK